MDRRDAIKAMATAIPLGAVGIEATAVEVDRGGEVIALVLRSETPLSAAATHYMRESLQSAFIGTPYEKTPKLVLSDGMSLEAVQMPSKASA